ncbi:MAG TPA: histidine kinase [Blastocatellia bacterium]|nr:histidine kinase [Blastocatellia bacterium]
MKAGRLFDRRWLRAFFIIGVWTLFGVFLASQSTLAFSRSVRPFSWQRILLVEMSFAYIWAALTPLVLWLARRYPLERGRLTRGLTVHVLASIILGFATRAFRDLTFVYFVSGYDGALPWTKLFFNGYLFFDYGTLLYWLMLLVSYATNYYRRYRTGEIRATRLEAQLAQAQLHALKMQLQPHFLFNTLHSISALVHKDPQAADKMIARLGDFLRLTLDSAGVQEVPLRQELEFLKSYLDIERIRFKDRLSVEMNIESQTLEARLPNLILQPIVENAIRHGIAPHIAAGRIEIAARRFNGSLQVQIIDNGPGLVTSGNNGRILKEGVGLANTQARLQQLYGDDSRLDLANTARGGLSVTLEIPFNAS